MSELIEEFDPVGEFPVNLLSGQNTPTDEEFEVVGEANILSEQTKPQEVVIPELRTAPEKSIIEKISGLFDNPYKKSQEAAQAIVDSEIYKISPYAALEMKDLIKKHKELNASDKNKSEEYLSYIQKFNDQGTKDSWAEGFWKSAKKVPYDLQIAAGGIMRSLEENKADTLIFALENRIGPIDQSTIDAIRLVGDQRAKRNLETIGEKIAESSQEKLKELQPFIEPDSKQEIANMAVESGLNFLLSSLPGMIIAKNNPKAAVELTLALFALQSKGQSYQEQREGVKGNGPYFVSSPTVASLASTVSGFSEYFEKTPVGIYFKPNISFVKRLSLSLLVEPVTEGLTQVAQDVVKKVNIRPDMTFREAYENVVKTTQATILMTPGLVGISHVATRQMIDKAPQDIKNVFVDAKKQALNNGLSPDEAVNAGMEAIKATPEGKKFVDDFMTDVSGVQEEEINVDDISDEDVDAITNLPEEELDAALDDIINRATKEIVSEPEDFADTLATEPTMAEVATSESIIEPPAQTPRRKIESDELINGITRAMAGDLMSKGDEEVLTHIREGIEKHGVLLMQDAIRNQEITEVVAAAKEGKEQRQKVVERIGQLKDRINNIFKEAGEQSITQHLAAINSALGEKGAIGVGFNPKKVNDAILSLGKAVWAEGKTTAETFLARMKDILGTIWENVKEFVHQAYREVKRFNANLGERGAIGDVGTDAILTKRLKVVFGKEKTPETIAEGINKAKDIADRVSNAINYYPITDIEKALFLKGKLAGIEAANKPKKESLKSRVRRITGQKWPEGPQVSEYEALKEVLKQVSRAAITFKREGNIEGVKKEHARMKQLIALARIRAKNRAEVRKYRGKIKTLLDNTKQKRNKKGKYTPEIQVVLNSLRKVASLSSSEAQQQINNNLQKYGQNGHEFTQEELLENYLLEIVARHQEVSDLNTIKLIHDEIKALVEEGKLINTLRRFNWSEEIRLKKELTEKELTGGKMLPADIDLVGKRQYVTNDKLKKFLKNFHTAGETIVGWNDIMDILSWLTKTKPGESFISKENNLHAVKNAEKKGNRTTFEFLQNLYMEVYGLKNKYEVKEKMQRDNTEEMTLLSVPLLTMDGRSHSVDLKFTTAELRKRVAELMDPTLWERFRDTMGYTEETVRRLTEALEPADKVFIARTMEFYQGYYTGINEVFREMRGVNLPFNDRHTPIAVEGYESSEDSGSDFLHDIFVRMSVSQISGLQERTGSKKAIKQRSDLTVLQAHVVDMEHYKAWALKLREIEAVWKSPRIRAAVELYHGTEILRIIDNFLNDFNANRYTLGARIKLLDRARINFQKSRLFGKVKIGIGQLSSVFTMLEKVGPINFSKNIVRFFKVLATNPDEIKQMLLNSESIRARWGGAERDLKEVMQEGDFSRLAGSGKFTDLLSLNIRLGDMGSAIMGGWIYKTYLVEKKNMSPDEAMFLAEQHIEDTMQSSDFDQQSYWQRAGSFGKLMSMFVSNPNQYVRKMLGATRNLYSGRITIGEAAKTLALYHFFLPMLYQFISDGFHWDSDEQKRTALLGPMNGFFLVGDGLEFLARWMVGAKTYDMNNPMLGLIHDIIKATSLVNLLDLSTEKIFKGLEAVGNIAGEVTGQPLGQVVNVGEGFSDVLSGEYEKGLYEVMGWSTTKAKEMAKD